MAGKTSIEWTDATWNAVTGCEKVSAGCDHCYAETFAERWRGTPGHYFENGFDVQLRPDKLEVPLRWRKPRRIFVNSMSDLFHADVPDAYIAKVFGVMALTPRHTYQVLTKRHARMRSLLNSDAFHLSVLAETARQQDERHPMPAWVPGACRLKAWPLPNVHLGVSVEDQKWADVRIPALLETPAAVRFLSCEPLLGPVDLTRWMPPISPVTPTEAPKRWADWSWPEWVPEEIRSQVEGFWDETWGRSPRTWMHDMHQQGAPAFGSVVTLNSGFGSNAPTVTGRYVHAWNNIGRIVLGDGTYAYTSFNTQTSRRQQQPIDWVIAGGESGPGARPMDIAWARTLRDQCAHSGVPFMFKQTGSVLARELGIPGKGTDLELLPADLQIREYPHA